MVGMTDHELAAKLKAHVALAALRGEETPEALAGLYGLDVRQVEEWKRELEQNASGAFRPGAPAPASSSAPVANSASVPGVQPRAVLDAPTLPASTMELPPATWPSREPFPNLLEARAGGSAGAAAQRETRARGNPNATYHDDEFWENFEGTLPAGRKVARPLASSRAGAREATSPANFLAPLFRGWKERRFVARECRELLELHGSIRAAEPALRGPDLYRRIVQSRMGGSAAEAEAILNGATESYANWPVPRPLIYQDVVHYLAVTEFLLSNGALHGWTHEDLRRIVANLVPDNL